MFGIFFRSVLLIAAALSANPSFALPPATQEFDRDAVVFIGSSTIEFWKTLTVDFSPLRTLNLGVGGTQYSDLIANAPEWAEKYPARTYVIYSGDNDIAWGAEPTTVAENFRETARRLVKAIPNVRLIVISIKPCTAPERRAKLEQVQIANAMIKEMAKTLGVEFVDVHTLMLDESGEPRPELFREDGVHMNADGYALWVDRLRPLLIPPK